MSKPTPGPWWLSDANHGMSNREISICCGEPVISPRSLGIEIHPRRDYESMLADARLIAAAPELLEALKKMAEYVAGDWTGYENRDLTGGDLTRARAVIAKAEGK